MIRIARIADLDVEVITPVATSLAAMDAAFRALPEPEQRAVLKRVFKTLNEADQEGFLDVALQAVPGPERRAMLETGLETASRLDRWTFAVMVLLAGKRKDGAS
jgi:hypothetical protein